MPYNLPKVYSSTVISIFTKLWDPHHNFRTFLSLLPPKNSVPFSSHLPCSTSFYNPQATDNLLSISAHSSLWAVSHKWCQATCILLWAFSYVFVGFIHVVACVRTSLLFITNLHSTVWYTTLCLFIRQLMNSWFASTFWLTVNNAAMNIHIQVFVWTFVFISVELTTWEDLLGHTTTLYLTFG